MSGHCVDFVTRADQLGALDRSELKKLPGFEASLKTTICWGCGPGNPQNITTLLVQVGTPPALAVLQTEPYRSLPPVRLPAPPPPLTPSAQPPQCEDLTNAIERNLCIGAPLQTARAYHERAFERCKELGIADLRPDLLADEPSLQTFNRSRCRIAALSDNGRGMLDAHPECAAP